MKTTATAELVFIPSPGMGHLMSTVEMAKQLVGRDQRLSITVLIMNRPRSFDNSKVSSSTQSLLVTAAEDRLKFVYLPQDEAAAAEIQSKYPGPNFTSELIKMNKQHVRDHVTKMVSTESTRIAGFVIDMFCTPMMDVAAELGIPSYVFFTPNASVLGLMFHFESRSRDENGDLTELKESDGELAVPVFVNPVPVKALPFLNKEVGSMLMGIAKRLRESKGIIVNTFEELESNAVRFLAEDDKIPPVYPVGPVIHLVKVDNEEEEEAMKIIRWLDNQPPASVVFLCFGSMGSFEGDQLTEIAQALEQSGHRFLWSVRRPPPMGKRELPGEYQDLNQVLPKGFLERTTEVGRVIGWAPQVAVLSHKAVGGFVSHCGWNSILESLWCGVPVAVWPMYAEQPANAFQLVRELGLAVEIKLDYQKDVGSANANVLVTAEEIEIGIQKLMVSGNEYGEDIKKRVKKVSEKSKVALVEGGSSYNYTRLLIEDFMKNIYGVFGSLELKMEWNRNSNEILFPCLVCKN